jgi:hypothetical protein
VSFSTNSLTGTEASDAFGGEPSGDDLNARELGCAASQRRQDVGTLRGCQIGNRKSSIRPTTNPVHPSTNAVAIFYFSTVWWNCQISAPRNGVASWRFIPLCLASAVRPLQFLSANLCSARELLKDGFLSRPIFRSIAALVLSRRSYLHDGSNPPPTGRLHSVQQDLLLLPQDFPSRCRRQSLGSSIGAEHQLIPDYGSVYADLEWSRIHCLGLHVLQGL